MDQVGAAVTNRDELLAAMDRDGIEFLFAMFVDMHGKPCAKLVPGSRHRAVRSTDGAGFAGFAAGPMGQTPADPTSWPCPTSASYIRAALAARSWRSCSATRTVEGEPWPFAPRVILRRQLERLRDDGT